MPSVVIIAGVAAAWFAVAAVAASAQPPPTSMVVTAVVGTSAGHALFPIARLVEQRWTNTWPGPEEDGKPIPPLDQVPLAWLGKPVPHRWTMWTSDGRRLPIAIARTVRSAGGCFDAVALLLDRQSAGLLNSREGTWALATDSDRPIELIRPISASAPERRELQLTIERAYRDRERQMAGSQPADERLREGLAELERRRAPIRIDRLVRPASDLAPLIYYFEAVRRVAGPSEFGIRVRGFLRREFDRRVRGPVPGGFPLTWSAVSISSDPFAAETMWSRLPEGLLRVAGRAYWISAINGYESLSFSIDDVSDTAVRQTVMAPYGGC